MSVFSQGQLDGAGKVRIPYASIIGSGSVSMDDIEQAALDPDGAVTVDVGGGPGGFMQAEQAGPRAGADAMAVTDAPAYGDPTVANDIAQVDAPQQSAAPPAPAAPQQPAAPAQRSGPSYMARGGTRFNKDYRYTNEDFYGPRGPDIFTTDAVGGSMYIPRAGELPMDIFASYFQENQRQRAEVRGAISKFMEASQVKPTADPYQPAFNKLVTDWQNNYVAGIAEQYGGNSQLAWAEIAKEGTAANKGYLDGMRAMDALGQFVKFQWADAASYIEEVMKGNLNASPEQKQRAYDVYYGMNSLKGDMTGGDFMKLAQETEMLKRDMNELKWFNERVLPMAPEAYRKVSQEPVVEMKGGKRILRQRTKEEVDAAFHDLLAKEGVATIGADEAELKKKLQSWFPRVKSETEEIKFVPKDGKGKGGSSGPESAVWVGSIERGVSPIAKMETEAYTMEDAMKGGVQGVRKGDKRTVDRVPIGEIVSKRRQNMGPRKFTDASGNPVEMRPQYIERDGAGTFYVVGRPVTPEESGAVTEEEVVEGKPFKRDGAIVTPKTTVKVDVKPQPDWVWVPVDGNEAALDSYLGGIDWRKRFGEDSPKGAAPKKQEKASDPLGILD